MFLLTTKLSSFRFISYTRKLSSSNELLSGIPPPLQGIKILDLTRVLAGPTATMLLADLGADVIKVEEVTRGDDTRSWLPPSAPTISSSPESSSHLPPESAYFLAVNRNKRSITVDFKKPEGLEILHKLVKQSDILVENFISGKLATMGLGYEDCKKINPKLIYASITGFPGMKIAGLANIASNYLIAGKEASRHGTAHPSIVPYQVFPCKDGYLMIGAGNNKQFKLLAEKILGNPGLSTDPKFATNDARVANREELVKIISDTLLKQDREHWLEQFTGLG
ncbi:hypothetical protein H0H81_010080 [Sphagnurus paluster]|uniref:Uncharacterized protein n=1 Tax=Sphagnurus paluster TaxID=117069 RepID=A0A9P7KKX8_9AGAR|nr:hypothetical protein H0H81_010080 [Sphagnurus paluster]